MKKKGKRKLTHYAEAESPIIIIRQLEVFNFSFIDQSLNHFFVKLEYDEFHSLLFYN